MNTQNGSHILIVDDDRMIRHVLSSALEEDGYSVTEAESVADCLSQIAKSPPQLVLLDLNLPDGSGMTMLQQVRSDYPNLPVILVTSEAGSDSAIDASKFGACEYLTKPIDLAQLRAALARTLSGTTENAIVDTAPAITPIESVDPLVGQSRQMQEVFKSIGRVANQKVSVLIRGESGTGKELVARAICSHSGRADEQFLAVNCAALSNELLESEIFGHEKGAFTGANAVHVGKFEACSRGTLFLDEVGDMHPAMQVKLLRVLQERTFTRVGGNTELQTDARIISATNRNLEAMCERGEFREDLFHRLNGFSIHLPPIRERKDDVPILLGHYLHRYNSKLNTRIDSISSQAAFLFQKYDWPGNVREVESLLSQAMLNAQRTTIEANDLPVYVRTPTERRVIGKPDEDKASIAGPQTAELEAFIEMLIASEVEDVYAQAQARMERYLLGRILEKTKGNQSAAARRLGITRGSLRFKLNQLGMSIDNKVSVSNRPR